MRIHGKYFAILAKSLVLAVAVVVFGSAAGCGDASQSARNEDSKAGSHEIDAKVKAAHLKKRLE